MMLSRGIQPSEVMSMSVGDFIFWLERCSEISDEENKAAQQ